MPELKFFNANQGIKAFNAGQQAKRQEHKFNSLKDIGQAINNGGLESGAQAAFGSGLVSEGIQLTNAHRQQIERLDAQKKAQLAEAVEDITKAALSASDDAAFQAMIPALSAKHGPELLKDYMAPGGRKRAAYEGQSLQQILQGQRADRAEAFRDRQFNATQSHRANMRDLAREKFEHAKAQGSGVKGAKIFRDKKTGAIERVMPDGTVQVLREGKPDQTAEMSKEIANRAANIVIDDIDHSLKLIDSGDFGLVNTTTGPLGSALSFVPGTGARDLDATLETIKANAGFDRLQQMRDASPTGGALGQVSDGERKALNAAIGNLEQSQSQGQLVANLRRVRDIYYEIIHGPGSAQQSAQGNALKQKYGLE